MKVHVVVGLYGMILNDLTVWTDKDAAMAKAQELCENYEVEPFESSFEDREGLFFVCVGVVLLVFSYGLIDVPALIVFGEFS